MTGMRALALVAVLLSAAPPIDSPGALRDLEAKVRDVAPRVRDAVVAIVVEPTPGKDGAEQGGTGSGTLISADGWVLTAGHVGQAPGRAVSVLLADGTELKGITAGQHFGPDGDMGLVKADPAGRTLPFAELGASTELATGDPVLALGHPLGPERTPWRPPPLRVGSVLGREGWRIAIDTTLSPGDSGGGVFDLDGRLVGVNSAAASRPELNLAATVESAKARMESLREGLATGAWLADPAKNPIEAAMEDRGEESAGERRLADDADAREEQYERRAGVLEALASLSDPYADAVVTVLVDSRDACYGTIIDDEGHVLTKASELGNPVRLVDVLLDDGQAVRARRLAEDRALDLAIVRIDPVDAVPVEFGDAPEPALGDALLTVGRGMAPLALGFRSLGPYVSGGSDAAGRAFLGVTLQAPTDEERARIPGGVGQVVRSVLPGGSAAAAGLRDGDVVVRIDGTVIDSAEAAAAPLRTHAPGDLVDVQVARDGGIVDMKIRLLRLPFMDPRHLNQGADVSRRCTGFGEVIQHDAVVPAQNVGSPVIDSRGRVVGLNIARADRMKTYALPSRVVAPAVARMMGRIRAGEVPPEADPSVGLAPVRFGADGFAHAVSGSARVSGPTNVVRPAAEARDGKPAAAPAIAGWADFDDMAVWRVEVPSAGRYDLALRARVKSGGKADVFLGDELMTVAVRRPGRGGLVRVGEVVMTGPGEVTLRVQPLGRPSGPMMDLEEVVLQRTDLLRAMERANSLLRFRDLDRLERELERDRRREERRRKEREQDAEAPADAPEANP
jgi:S1-C subfamily serine protease